MRRRYLWLSLAFAGACAPARATVATPPSSIGSAACSKGDSQMIFMIDGQPVTCTAAMSFPRDRIESVEILKGNAATALYGARGSAGVVIIQTKRAR